MIKTLQTKLMLLLTMMLVGAGSAWAEETAYKTLTFPDDNSASNKVSSYTQTWTAQIGDDTWSIVNFNNNNWTGWSYIKCGRKNYASVGSIITDGAIDKAITKVVVTIDALTSSKLNSSKLYVSSNSDFTNAQTVSVIITATGDASFEIASPAENSFYKLEFDCASASSNGVVQLSKVVYYYDDGAVAKTPAGLAFETDSYEVEINGELDTPTLTNPNNLTVKYSSSDENIVVVDENTGELLIGDQVGTVTITASSEETEVFAAGSASYTIKVYDPNANDGSEAKPYTVAEAREIILAYTTNTATTEKYYVKGIVSRFYNTSVMGDGTNYRYYISDDGNAENELLIYRGLNLNEEAFSSADDLQIGDQVVIYGPFQKYNSTAEMASGNYIVSRIAAAPKADPELSFGSTTEFEINLGDSFTAPTLTNPHGLTVTYSSSNETVAMVDETTGEVVLMDEGGTTTITATFAGNDEYKAGSASYTLTVNNPYQDVIMASSITFSASSSYCDWDSVDDINTNATYTGNSNYSINVIQFRSSSYAGIITTGTAGRVKKISVDWDISTQSGRTLNIYAKNTPYAAVSDLFDESTQGKLIGTIVYGTSTSLTLDGNYGYFGMRSSNGALYLNNIKIDWDINEECATVTDADWATWIPTNNVEVPQGVTAFIVNDVTESSVSLQEVLTIPANEPVVLKTAGDFAFSVISGDELIDDVTANMLKVVAEDESITEAYVLANIKNKPAFYLYNGNGLKTGRVYLPATSTARQMLTLGDETTTGINAVEKVMNFGEVYDLQGRRVQQTQKGLYIMGGKKLIVK